MGTFGTRINGGLVFETPDPTYVDPAGAGATNTKRPAPFTVKVKNADTMDDLDSFTTTDYGDWSYVTTLSGANVDVDLIYLSTDNWSTSMGPFESAERVAEPRQQGGGGTSNFSPIGASMAIAPDKPSARAVIDAASNVDDTTIQGLYTFVQPPQVPTPVGDDDAVSKVYVDSSFETVAPSGSYRIYTATGDDSNLSAALASVPADAVLVAVKVAGS